MKSSLYTCFLYVFVSYALPARNNDEGKYNTIHHSTVMTIEISFLNNNINNNSTNNNSDFVKLLKSVKYFRRYIKECKKYFGQLKTKHK